MKPFPPMVLGDFWEPQTGQRWPLEELNLSKEFLSLKVKIPVKLFFRKSSAW